MKRSAVYILNARIFPLTLQKLDILTQSHQYINTSSKLLCNSSSSDTDNKGDKISGKVVAKIRTSIIYDDSMKSTKQITPLRATKEYLLSYKEIENLPKFYSRSPYSWETDILVLSRSDVEDLAYAKYGGKEQFEIIQKKAKEIERRQRMEFFSSKKSAVQQEKKSAAEEPDTLYKSQVGKVILSAIAINGTNFVAKTVAWWLTGSKSMFSEALHSLADTVNQVILAYGLHSSLQVPDDEHPYGYVSMQNITSLISGVGIFCLGAGISFYHGVQGLFSVHEIQSFHWAAIVMSSVMLSESVTFVMAINHALKSAKERGFLLREYIMEGVDPAINVVLLEDFAALAGVLVASSAMGMSYLLDSPIPDIVGSIVISGILGGVAGFIVWTNAETLIGKSIPIHQRDAIMKIFDKDKIIRGTYDIKATTMGGEYIKFKAEVDIDGRELTKRYLETVPLDKILAQCKSIETEEELVHFLLNQGENIVQILGAEVNKIEDKIKKNFPSVKHIDIEIN